MPRYPSHRAADSALTEIGASNGLLRHTSRKAATSRGTPPQTSTTLPASSTTGRDSSWPTQPEPSTPQAAVGPGWVIRWLSRPGRGAGIKRRLSDVIYRALQADQPLQGEDETIPTMAELCRRGTALFVDLLVPEAGPRLYGSPGRLANAMPSIKVEHAYELQHFGPTRSP